MCTPRAIVATTIPRDFLIDFRSRHGRCIRTHIPSTVATPANIKARPA
jgi:hypothetical protein